MVNVIWIRRFNLITAKRIDSFCPEGADLFGFSKWKRTARESATYCVPINFYVNFEEMKECKDLTFLTSVRGFGFNKQE